MLLREGLDKILIEIFLLVQSIDFRFFIFSLAHGDDEQVDD